jgi:hypothetical protein
LLSKRKLEFIRIPILISQYHMIQLYQNYYKKPSNIYTNYKNTINPIHPSPKGKGFLGLERLKEETMRITIQQSAYNPRRDSKPWIGRCTEWAIGKPYPEMAWGAFIGDSHGGELEVEAAPGQIIRWGQNDLRGGNHTYRQYGRVEADGSVTRIRSTEASKILKTPKPVAVTPIVSDLAASMGGRSFGVSEFRVPNPGGIPLFCKLNLYSDGSVGVVAYDDFDDVEDTVECPACGGGGVSMGTLGQCEHFRCQNCGIDFSRIRGVNEPQSEVVENQRVNVPKSPQWSTRFATSGTSPKARKANDPSAREEAKVEKGRMGLLSCLDSYDTLDEALNFVPGRLASWIEEGIQASSFHFGEDIGCEASRARMMELVRLGESEKVYGEMVEEGVDKPLSKITLMKHGKQPFLPLPPISEGTSDSEVAENLGRGVYKQPTTAAGDKLGKAIAKSGGKVVSVLYLYKIGDKYTWIEQDSGKKVESGSSIQEAKNLRKIWILPRRIEMIQAQFKLRLSPSRRRGIYQWLRRKYDDKDWNFYPSSEAKTKETQFGHYGTFQPETTRFMEPKGVGTIVFDTSRGHTVVTAAEN